MPYGLSTYPSRRSGLRRWLALWLLEVLWEHDFSWKREPRLESQVPHERPSPAGNVVLAFPGVHALPVYRVADAGKGVCHFGPAAEGFDQFSLCGHHPENIRNIYGQVKRRMTAVSSHDPQMLRRQTRPMAEASDPKGEYGARLRQAREALGWNIRRLAQLTDISEDSLSNWERGVAGVPPWYVSKLKEKFGITHDWIYHGDRRSLPFEIAIKLEAEEEA